jgi:hypothetical protein
MGGVFVCAFVYAGRAMGLPGGGFSSAACMAGAAKLKQVYKGVDLNDLVNYSIMRRLGLQDVFTNDSHFQQLPDIVPRF